MAVFLLPHTTCISGVDQQAGGSHSLKGSQPTHVSNRVNLMTESFAELFEASQANLA
ncbi:hypothetical protein D3C73_1606760 [compost metagenome]